MIRWPGHIPAGGASDEIVHIVDMFPTLASMTDSKVPADRFIDGVDHAAFFLGETNQSAREGFLIYVGNELTAWKWRTWKAHFVWQPTKYDTRQSFSTVPKLVNLITDPREERQVAEPYNGWLQYPMARQVGAFRKSLEENPVVPMGAPDDWKP